jgi:hypothetical protein
MAAGEARRWFITSDQGTKRLIFVLPPQHDVQQRQTRATTIRADRACMGFPGKDQ